MHLKGWSTKQHYYQFWTTAACITAHILNGHEVPYVGIKGGVVGKKGPQKGGGAGNECEETEKNKENHCIKT